MRLLRIGSVMLALLFSMTAMTARADKIRDIATFAGVRPNQLIGYGLVVGLDGSGDQTTQTPFTVQSVTNMLNNLGVQVPAAAICSSRTWRPSPLPPHCRPLPGRDNRSISLCRR